MTETAKSCIIACVDEGKPVTAYALAFPVYTIIIGIKRHRRDKRLVMKNWIRKLIQKGIDFLKWVWSECKSWHTLVLLGVVCLVLSLPIWMGYILWFIFDWGWAFWVSTGLWAFWWLPGAPFFAVAVAITLAIKKIYEKRLEKKAAKKE